MNNVTEGEWNLFGSELPPLELTEIKFFSCSGIWQGTWELLKWSSWTCSIGSHLDTYWPYPLMQLKDLKQELSLFSLQILVMLDSGISLATSRRKKGNFLITKIINDFRMSKP